MPTFHDPLADAAEASEALRSLAHASRVFDDPADTYWVFGDLVAGVRSLRQVLDQLATTHLNARNRAFDDNDDHAAGAASALAAADELHQAGTLLDQAYDRLDAAFSHSGRIAWHPEPVVDRDAARERLAARLDGDPAITTMQAGSLGLTVWPDAPVDEHQRYAYRITDTTTDQTVEGRDLFTGAGTPVDPHHAIRDLATYLSTAGETRQYALDHPGTSSPEHEGLFPAWVAEAARTNTGALTELAEHGPARPGVGAVPQRWINVAFLQGEEADAVLDLIDRDGAEAAIAHLRGYDSGEETTQAALENGHVYDDQPPASGTDRTVQDDWYALTYNHALSHVGLYRQLDTSPEPALLDDLHVPASIRTRTSPRAQQPAHEGRQARHAGWSADRDWYAGPANASTGSRQGLSL